MAKAEILPPKDHAEKVERLRTVLRTIEKNPQHWDQGYFHSPCGTSHCFAGFAAMFAIGLKQATNADIQEKSDLSTAEIAEKWLGIEEWSGRNLFYYDNTIDDLRSIVNEIADAP